MADITAKRHKKSFKIYVLKPRRDKKRMQILVAYLVLQNYI